MLYFFYIWGKSIIMKKLVYFIPLLLLLISCGGNKSEVSLEEHLINNEFFSLKSSGTAMFGQKDSPQWTYSIRFREKNKAEMWIIQSSGVEHHSIGEWSLDKSKTPYVLSINGFANEHGFSDYNGKWSIDDFDCITQTASNSDGLMQGSLCKSNRSEWDSITK